MRDEERVGWKARTYLHAPRILRGEPLEDRSDGLRAVSACQFPSMLPRDDSTAFSSSTAQTHLARAAPAYSQGVSSAWSSDRKMGAPDGVKVDD